METNHVHYFGDLEMGRIVERILTDGHDVQLHVHPVWDAFRNQDWQSVPREQQPNDRFADRSADHSIRLLAEGVRTLKTWTGADPLAFRAGGLTAERPLYQAMASVGLPVSSNVGIGIHRPSDPVLHCNGGRFRLDGVVEVPVTTYELCTPFMAKLEKCLTVVGSSLAEFTALLSAAASSKAGPVVILTHPFEFVTADKEYRSLKVHPLVKSRFWKLCRYLKQNAKRYTVVTFAERAAAWRGNGEGGEFRIALPARYLLQRCAVKKLDQWTATCRAAIPMI